MPTRLALSSLLVVLALLSGCMGDSSTGEDSFAGDLTYEDGFDEDTSFGEGSFDFGTAGFSEDEYLVNFTRAPGTITAHPKELFQGADLTVADSVQTVDVRSETPESPQVGLVCRYNEKAGSAFRGYGFVLSTRSGQGSRWVLGRTDDNGPVSLQSGSLDIDLSEETASLEGSCVGDTLTFSINGEEVASVTDASFESGSNGIIASVAEGREPPIAATFDNYVLEYDEQLGEG